MQADPAREWQRLTRLYGEMSDEELENLAASFSDLTEFARPILRDEMRKRGLGDPTSASRPTAKPLPEPAPFRFESESNPILGGGLNSEQSDEPESQGQSEEAAPHEYTWKTLLCECETREEVKQISEVLRRACIETWSSGPSSYFGSQTTRILVAADQLDEARQILARPIPQDIIDQSKIKVEDFVPPTCPKCGAEDPLLESVEPTNTWRCESCGARWADSQAFDSASSSGY